MHPFDRVSLDSLWLDNRLLMAPVKTAFAGQDGRVTDRLIAYYRRRAQGGVGGIILEPMYIHAAGKEHPKQLGIDDDDKVEGLRRLVDSVHGDGARAIAHINHAGRAANPKASGQAPEAPSALACPSTGALPEALSTERIEELIAAYGRAAWRAQEAGFDAIEVQCGLGYLVAQFFSPRTNQRDDPWGGTAEKREQFVRRAISTVRETANLPVMARISGSEHIEGGLTKADAIHLGRVLFEHGVVALHVASGSACDSPPWYYQHMSLPLNANAELAQSLREELQGPIVVAGRLGDPEAIRRLFARDGADLVALGRPLVVDPDLPKKMREGHAEQVLQCGACLQGCLVGVKSGRGIGCIVNPELGSEGQEINEPGASKRIVVVGGGPAGLTAARIAAERGHRVTLLERSRELGGQFCLSHLAPGKQGMHRTLETLVRLTEESGAEIRKATEATVAGVTELAPDAVIVATGAEAVVPEIPGLREAATGGEVLTGTVVPGRRVLVIGGGLVGIEVAEYLAERSREVVVVELLEEIARDMDPITRKLTLNRLAGLPVAIHTATRVTQITERHALVTRNGKDSDLGEFDTIVVAVGTRPFDPLSAQLQSEGVEVHTVGDANTLGQIQGAVTSAWKVASRI
jgi:2,4-dienoyl-CoA reductase-like NADH-dependent reductase (Old Yellow Enzyme family)/thioredoxin reductase